MDDSGAEQSERLRHRSLQARALHPRGEWIEFPRDGIDQSIPERFETIVSLHSHRIAVAAKDGDLTYRELDESANRLAHAILRRRGPEAEPVGVLVQHGIPAVVATLAVLKAGKFYVPLDPQYPGDRLMYMLDDTDAALILTDRRYYATATGLARGRIPILVTDERAADFPAHRPKQPIAPEALAGIYYTSGSTGRPKGIVYTHRYLLHNMMNYGNAFHVCPEDRWTWLHSYSFSPASTDIFCPLLHGATVCPWNVQAEGVTNLAKWVDDIGVTIFHWMATPFRTFASTLDRFRPFGGVRLAVFGGETLVTSDVNAFFRVFAPECIFVNRLGASEIGLYQLYFFDRDTALDNGFVPAGYGVPDKTAVILDANGAESAPGEIGEIAVRSHYFPPGYWRQPELTREKYRNDIGTDGARVYLTGDLGRMRTDGCLEYCGRKDSQLKIRGNRVETKEIESVIRELPGVDEAVVKAWAKPSGESYLTAYFVSTGRAAVDVAAIQSHLLRKLPAYMIPVAFVRLDTLPRNANQKIDMVALPAPNLTPDLPTDRYAPPQTRLQRYLVDLWQTILKIRPIGVDDDFFALGGTSLRGMRMVSELQPLLDSILHVPPLLEHPTVALYASFLEINYGRELQRRGVVEVLARSSDATGLDELKLGRVRDEIAAFPIADRSADRGKDKNPSAIFVLAPGRSGTTLLRVILGGHPQLFAPPELHLLSYTTMEERRSVISRRSQREKLDGAIQAQMSAGNCPVGEADWIIRGFEDAQLPVREFYRQLQAKVSPRRLVDKTPMYAWHPETLERAEELFDQPMYIHLLRHPYGVILSYEEMRMDQMALIRRPAAVSLTEFAEALWQISHRNILDFLARIPGNRQMRLSFENLVTEPEATIASLCRFLELDPHPGMLDPYGERQQRMTKQIRALNWVIGDPKFNQHKAIDPGAADRWREVYREDFLCADTWRLAELMGYARAQGAASRARLT